MTAPYFNNNSARYMPTKPSTVRREPRMTFAELAREFGVTSRALQGLKRTQSGLVALPPLKGAPTPNPSTSRYSPSAARAWWAALPAHVKGIQ